MISSLLNIEKRPNINLMEMSRNLSQIYEEHFTFKKLSLIRCLFTKKYMINVDVYGPFWTKAYINTVITRFSHDCFRIIAVHLLDEMVAKLLERTFDSLDEKHNMVQEQKLTDKVNRLVDIRNIMVSFCKSNVEN